MMVDHDLHASVVWRTKKLESALPTATALVADDQAKARIELPDPMCCYAMSCCEVLCHVMSCRVMSCYVIFYCVVIIYVMLHHAIVLNRMLCNVASLYVMSK